MCRTEAEKKHACKEACQARARAPCLACGGKGLRVLLAYPRRVAPPRLGSPARALGLACPFSLSSYAPARALQVAFSAACDRAFPPTADGGTSNYKTCLQYMEQSCKDTCAQVSARPCRPPAFAERSGGYSEEGNPSRFFLGVAGG